MRMIEEVMLNFASIAGNNNKFYNLRFYEDGGEFVVEAKYGRLGTRGQSTRKSFVYEHQGKKFYDRKYREKIRGGYVEIEVSGKSTNKSSGRGGTDNLKIIRENKKIDEDTSLVYNMLMNFVGSSRSFVRSHVNMPLGSLSYNQIKKGYHVLDEIEKSLKSNNLDGARLIRLSDEFYRAFPVVFGHSRGSRSDLVIDNLGKLGDKRDLVDVALSLVKTSQLDNVEQVYKSLDMRIRPLKKTTKKYSNLVDRIHRNQSDYHKFNINVKNIYEINKPEWDNNFNPHKVRVNMLYHGSRMENLLNILQTGLKIKPPGAAHTGSMFGNGIYFADQSTKSANYCWGFNRQKGTYYMLICEVAVGKMYNMESADSSLKRAPMGYNCVRGVKGRSLLHNEIIVYNESQSNIRYIVEFEV